MSTSDVPSAPSHRHRAVVVGGGLAGMLAAAALSDSVDEVTVIERDVLPSGPEPRSHLPQARHAHILWSGGAEAMERLLPGVSQAWLAAGARRVPLTSQMVALSPQGWYRRWRESHYLISCGRDLLDATVRDRVLALPNVTVLDATRVLGLVGDAHRVTGVRVRRRDGTEELLGAGLTVDASGRGTHTPRWLDALGVPAAREEVVDPGVVYASRLYRSPAGDQSFPVVNVQANARAAEPGRTAVILPVEDGRWLVTLSGTRGARPTSDPEAFGPFALAARHPIVGRLIAGAEPLSEVSTFAHTAGRRHFFEKVKGWPEGYVALGDAVAVYNPVYGHGMSVAAQGALALREALAAHGVTAPRLARRVQRAVAGPVGTAWLLAGQDIFYPGATARRPRMIERILGRCVDRLMRTSTGNYTVATALTDVMTLTAPVTSLLRPAVLLAAFRGPGRPQLTEPPLTDRELALVQSPQKTP
ncbi:FAD-dependent monooxygenase [Streptomyces sp. NBC_00083]|uniref:FAD-dependent monooxygenase n=1 Tax=Streptomyces sp. NBC_00083 TaxID=2975647 RepID=UPI00225487A1|nr:FAD-dependent monooxygenase [Streptomyces sp. NBC_00083]MCX5386678.1 FAD-dependent monooxygenase [Streptomyces sp. NBC_00083]